MTDKPQEPKNSPFQAMRAQLPAVDPLSEPGYLQYWDMRAEADPEEARVANIVKALTHVTLRGETDASIKQEFTRRDPALQARMWYRCLGPLNPMGADATPDLLRAAELTYMKQGVDWRETTNLRLDNANILADLGRASQDPDVQRRSIGLGLDVVKEIKADNGFDKLEAVTRLQTDILEGDLKHDALRLRYLESLKPVSAKLDTYREYENAVVREDLRQIAEFGKQVQAGVGDENFGILFEWYLILARRHEAWANEELDITTVRGATSRENAEWRGDFSSDITDTVTANHDIVIEKEGQRSTLLQLKAVNKGIRRYHPRITVLDYQDVLKSRFPGIDGAISQLTGNLSKFRAEYQL